MRMEGTRVRWFTFLLSCTAVMIVNIHLQLCGSAATQALASCFRLQILEESIIHVLCSNWKITSWKININLWFRITFNYCCTGQSNEWEQSEQKFWSKRGNESKTDKSLTHPTRMKEYIVICFQLALLALRVWVCRNSSSSVNIMRKKFDCLIVV